MIYRLFIVSLIVMVMVACTTTQARRFTLDVAGVGTGLMVFDQTLELAVDAVTRNFGQYTPDEQAKLHEIQARLETVRDSIAGMLDNAGHVAQVMVAPDQIMILHWQARQVYREAKSLVMPRFSSLPPPDQQLLLNLDAHARRLDANLSRLVNVPGGADMTPSILELLTVVTLVSQAMQ
ncbi:MAG: hypothetical protein KZQ94_21455 [Candidatus Thiodiazotropha sp. (ex Troendleina suluensis)]|nr:hypothetical protein [Candidatus Thiodiazotropha sp. (ex Troendleina suluensis)]